MPNDNLENLITQKARDLGFDDVGFTQDLTSDYEDHFRSWLKQGKQADLHWLSRNIEKRINPGALLEGARSAVVLLSSYYHENNSARTYHLARYAYGKDYHLWIRDKHNQLIDFMKNKINPQGKFRSFVDSGPLFERELAKKAHLGWIGKNTCLIHQKLGSFIFLSVILCDLQLSSQTRPVPHCGSCDRCVQACPTQALSPHELDTRKCLAYHTIELRGQRPELCWDKTGACVLGCDVCQNVCPWNARVKETDNQNWLASFSEFDLGDPQDILSMTQQDFNRKVRETAVSRVAYDDFMRNLFLVIANTKQVALLQDLRNWKERNPDVFMAEWLWCVQQLEKYL